MRSTSRSHLICVSFLLWQIGLIIAANPATAAAGVTAQLSLLATYIVVIGVRGNRVASRAMSISSRTRHGAMDPVILPLFVKFGWMTAADLRRRLHEFDYEDAELRDLIESMVSRDMIEGMEQDGEMQYRLSPGGRERLNSLVPTFDRRVAVGSAVVGMVLTVVFAVAPTFNGHPLLAYCSTVLTWATVIASVLIARAASVRKKADPVLARIAEHDRRTR